MNLKHIGCLSVAAASTCLLAGGLSAQTIKSAQPNVILIMTDDQGYGDFGCTGNKNISTPNIDKFYAQSVRFTDYHCGTTSAPTRSGLMTGHYNNTTGVWHTIMGRSILDKEEVTLAQAFSNSGYTTSMFGKWHLGDNHTYRPEDRGFQHTLTHGGGGVGQTPDYWDNNYMDDTYFRNGVPEKQKGYCTDVWFAEAIKFIEQNQNEPFFCYLALNAPHSPYHVPEKYAAPYRDNPEIPNAAYYGMVTNIDENMGVLLRRLDEMGLDDNTIVIFMTDNGTGGGAVTDSKGFVTKGYNANMRGKKGSQYEGGHRVPFFIRIPVQKPRDVSTLVAHIDIMPTLIDMCGLTMPHKVNFDGVSIAPILGGVDIAPRMLCVDTQREELLEKDKKSCVMEGSWRLVNGRELYDISVDSEQRNNIAAQHPERVERMKAFYQRWWERNDDRADDYQYINIDEKGDNVLTVHDAHNATDLKSVPAWNQTSVRRGTALYEGFWAIDLPEDGDYYVDLFRWAPESGLGLLETAPKGKVAPNSNNNIEGKVIPITGAKLQIGSYNSSQTVGRDAGAYVRFDATLAKGKNFMKADFVTDAGKSFSSYYVRITKK